MESNIAEVSQIVGLIVTIAGTILVSVAEVSFFMYLVYKLSCWMQHALVDSLGGWKTFLEYREWYREHKQKNPF